jgi:hypothetical protein
VHQTFEDFVTLRKFSDDTNRISLEQYLKIEYLNLIPEIVCEVLCYLSGYVHHRNDQISHAVYSRKLVTQINGGSLATDEMKENYEKDGWRYTPRGLDEQV